MPTVAGQPPLGAATAMDAATMARAIAMVAQAVSMAGATVTAAGRIMAAAIATAAGIRRQGAAIATAVAMLESATATAARFQGVSIVAFESDTYEMEGEFALVSLTGVHRHGNRPMAPTECVGSRQRA